MSFSPQVELLPDPTSRGWLQTPPWNKDQPEKGKGYSAAELLGDAYLSRTQSSLGFSETHASMPNGQKQVSDPPMWHTLYPSVSRFGPRCIRAASVAMLPVPYNDRGGLTAWHGSWSKEVKHTPATILEPSSSPETALRQTIPFMGPAPSGGRRPTPPVRQTWETSTLGAPRHSIKVNWVPVARPVQRRMPKPGKRYKDRHLG